MKLFLLRDIKMPNAVPHCPEFEAVRPWLCERNRIRDLIDEAIQGDNEQLANLIMDIETALIAIRRGLDSETNERIRLSLQQSTHEDRLNEHSNILELHNERLDHIEHQE